MQSQPTSAPTDASRTITVQDSQPEPSIPNVPPESDGVLRLRGGPRRNRPRVTWKEEVVDNEGCGKKKSKICCIYHKPRAFDESSDESDGSDSSESDESADDQARPSQSFGVRRGHGHVHRPGKEGDANAYERPSQSQPQGQSSK